jgi:DNA invertase Pin-like site-specific DNA recombinase
LRLYLAAILPTAQPIQSKRSAAHIARRAAATTRAKKVYTDKTSGTKAERPGLERALADVRPGDSLVVWKLDRLGRSPMST